MQSRRLADDAGGLVDYLNNRYEDWSDAYRNQRHASIIKPEHSAPVVKRVIESRICNGKRLQVSGAFRGTRCGDGLRWIEVDVEARGTGESMGKRWVRRDKSGAWDVRSERP